MAHIPKQAASSQAQGSQEAAAVPAPVQADAKLDPVNREYVAKIQFEADADLRKHYATIAFTEIVRWQLANNRGGGQEGVAADWAFRYADRMVDNSKKRPSLPSYNARGIAGIAEAPTVPEPVAPTADLAPLAEIP